jgi:hypothetical protein
MKRSTLAIVLAWPLTTLLLFCGAVSAQTIKVNGLITGRNGATMTLQTASDPKLVVLLTDDTQVAQVQGVLKARRKQMSSSVGSASLNQKLSEDRANTVTQFLQQQGHVPLTNMLAPGAMGESRQVGSNKTAEGQEQNRRVVVRVLQNKGIAGS